MSSSKTQMLLLEVEDYIPQTLIVLLEINSILCVYIWPLWPSFVNSSLNNVTILHWPISASHQIPDRFYVISMEFLSLSHIAVLPAKRDPCQQWRASRNGCFCRLLSSKVSWFGHYALVNSRCTHALPGQLLGIKIARLASQSSDVTWPGGRAFANPRATPKLLSHTCIPFQT